ncbi:MAG: glycosyltransferase family 2 protein [Bacilli bacterium]|nr:glycosyltransferase family 2 protein [Bacilli bacterium]MDD4283052.1 glycosyltransferase family 2 protein [Bacilli bacterium]MDD4719132.1 glycosyltransferase family 2 protein [Bacilli bacterium]
MKLSLVVPCYNEEENVELFYNEVVKSFKGENFKYEIIFINDGSKDETVTILKDIASNSKENIKIINFSRNFGKEAGMYAGLKESSGDYVSIIDADLQQHPSLVLEMLNILEGNPEHDSVAAFQEKRKDPFFKRIFSNLFYKIINKISDIEFVPGASDFRLLNRNMVNAILEMSEYYRFSKGIFSFVGFNTYYIPYEAEKRAHGSSKWSFWGLFKYAIEGIVAFTTAPLRIATFIGILISLIAFIYLLILVIQTIALGIAVPGYASTLGAVLLLGGIQLFALGIIGEYLGRTYVETKRRPIYIAKEVIDNNKKQ